MWMGLLLTVGGGLWKPGLLGSMNGYRDLFGIIKEFKLKVQVRHTFLNLPCIINTRFEVYLEI